MIDFEAAGVSRGELMRRLAAQGIGSQVHYGPCTFSLVTGDRMAV
jgi:hypothetical protein